MRARTKLQEVSNKLIPCGIESAENEARLLISSGLGIDIANIYIDNPEMDDLQHDMINDMVNRRFSREPIQYILGHVDFFDLKILVGQGVLIPRPETELMVENAIRILKARTSDNLPDVKENEQLTVLDLCTGSGCIGLALATSFPEARVYGTDISEIAISYAEKNAAINNIQNANFLCGNLFQPVSTESFDLIISNPPYIKRGEIQDLQPEIKNWEPVNALDGGEDGLDYYRKIIPAARSFLNNNGIIIIELGVDSAKEVYCMLNNTGYSDIKLTEDYSGFKRIIQARWIK